MQVVVDLGRAYKYHMKTAEIELFFPQAENQSSWQIEIYFIKTVFPQIRPS